MSHVAVENVHGLDQQVGLLIVFIIIVCVLFSWETQSKVLSGGLLLFCSVILLTG